MIFDAARIWLLITTHEKRRKLVFYLAYFVVFQAKIGNTTHRRCLSLGQVLVHLVDAL